MVHEITLIDGSKLECYPKEHPHSVAQSDSPAIDTTGEYLQIGKFDPSVLGGIINERSAQFQISHKLFYEHIHMFLANADRILSDSRLFLAPVYVDNGLSVTGKSGLENPTLGIYVEWWLHHKEASIDANGLPIWFISGSPLSGSHACSTVDQNGKTQDAQLNGRFLPVWSSFMEVNKRYTPAKGIYKAYNLQQVIDILENKTPVK